ncbi:MAG TPA: hypothetical protein VNP73_05340 [Actinomycetota bacterium]|nr:hypothetical protein [Actinomycetota bacterium]
MADKDSFQIVFLCTGNRARSAMAEAFVRKMTQDLPVEVSSAGLLELEAGPALPEAVLASSRVGIDLSEHRSRPITQTKFDHTDLVLGFERQHISTAVVDGGADPGKSFLLRELLRLLDSLPLEDPSGDGIERAKMKVASAHRFRVTAPNFSVDDEIADPYGKEERVFDRLANELYRSCAALTESLFGVKVSLIDIPEPVGSTRPKGGFLGKLKRG